MIREEDPRFIHLEKKIGIFVAIAAAGLIAVIVSIGLDKDLFTQKYRLKFTVEKGTGFSKGMPVKLSGFRIGRLKSVSLNEQAQVDIEVEIDKKYQKWIKQDSRARLMKEGLVGDNIIEISVGTPKQPMLKDGEFIGYRKSKDLEEVANEIADQVKPVLLEVKEIISYVNDPRGDIKQSLANVRELTRDLKTTRGRADELLVSSKDRIERVSTDTEKLLKSGKERVDGLAPMLERVDRSLEKVDRSLAQVQEKLPPILTKADTTLGHLERSSASVEKEGNRFLPQVAPLLGRSSDLMQDTDEVMKALKQTWPLRSHLPEPGFREFVPGDSYE